MIKLNNECYVDLEVAKLLKEVGFDWKVMSFYTDDITEGCESEYELRLVKFDNRNCKDKTWCNLVSAPTLDVAQRWLREVKHLNISIIYDPTIKIKPYMYEIYDMDEKFDDIFGIISPVTHNTTHGYFYTYEDAQETSIKKAIEITLEKG